MRGHDVLRVQQIGMATAADEDNLTKAAELGRLLVTRDRDYGNLVFVRGIRVGVIYIRALPAEIPKAHDELKRVLSTYSEAELRHSFIVVESAGHRKRTIS